MKNLKKLLALLLALVMTVSVMAGCTGNEDTTPSDEDTQASPDGSQPAADDTTAPAADGPQYGGHLDVRAVSCNGLDPLKQTAAWNYQRTSMSFENALTRDAENQIAPGVCDYELSEDQLTLKMWVRDGMIFHNGDPVDIYDVQASYQRAFNLYSSIITKVVPYVESMGVDADGKTLVMKFTENREDILYYLANYRTWCAVMPKEICEKYAEELNTITLEDAIGTGPYKVTDFVVDVSVTFERFEDYVVQESDRTGMAGPKYAYLDSVTFWANSDDSSATMALMAHDYDVTEVVASDYMPMLEENNIVLSKYVCETGCDMAFNAYGANNVCSKYPSLRKAVMAAIDYEEFLNVVTDGSYVMTKSPISDTSYDTEAFVNADYYGPANLEVAAKYIEMAKEEGWNGTDPVIYPSSDNRSDHITMVQSYLEKAGIPFEALVMENSSDFVLDLNNNWDVFFRWPGYAATPTLLQDSVVNRYWKNPEKDALIAEMKTQIVGSDEYRANWEKLAQMWADDCCQPFMSMIDWWWFHDADLVTNDVGVQRYWFNAYWKNPEEHQD